MYSSQNTTKQLQESSIETAIIPFGSTEQFGPHLPMNIDSLLADLYTRHYGTILNAYCLPVIPFNTSEEHAGFRGTITLSPQLLMQMTEEIICGLARQHFKTFVIVSGHGGAYWIGPSMKHLNYKYPDLLIVHAHQGSADAWQEANKVAGFGDRNDIHGGLAGLCTALYLCPERIDLDTIDAFGTDIAPELNQLMDYVGWERLTPDGSWGRFERTPEMTRDWLTERGKLLWETFLTIQGRKLKQHVEEAQHLKFGK